MVKNHNKGAAGASSPAWATVETAERAVALAGAAAIAAAGGPDPRRISSSPHFDEDGIFGGGSSASFDPNKGASEELAPAVAWRADWRVTDAFEDADVYRSLLALCARAAAMGRVFGPAPKRADARAKGGDGIHADADVKTPTSVVVLPEHRSRTVGVAFTVTDDDEDAAGDAIACIWRMLNKGRPIQGDGVALARAIARNYGFNRSRSQRRHDDLARRADAERTVALASHNERAAVALGAIDETRALMSAEDRDAFDRARDCWRARRDGGVTHTTPIRSDHALRTMRRLALRAAGDDWRPDAPASIEEIRAHHARDAR